MKPQGWPSAATWNGVLFLMVLLAGCGGGGDSGGTGGGSAAPAARAQGDERAPVGTAVTLDGTASHAPSGAPVSYRWTLTEKPEGSTVSLANATSARPTFTPDVAGRYTVTLVVTASGVTSQPDSVSIDCVPGNVAPRANAGPDRSAVVGRAITLDGTASHDPNKTPITYNWRILTQPTGSTPVFTNTTAAMPTFTANTPGLYTVALTVSDGSLTSPADQMEITVGTGNLPPVANAGPDQTVTLGEVVTLSGTGSTDPNGDPLTYRWCLQGRPEGSTATISAANTAQPTFTPDVAGSYVFCLTVNDGLSGSASDTVVVEARLPRFNQGSGFNGIVHSMVLAPDGSGDLFVGGGFTAYNGTEANRLIRLHRDGTVAQTFGQGFDGNVGVALATTGGGELYINLTGGTTNFDGQPVPPLIRLTPTGSLDAGFRFAGNFAPQGIAVAKDGSGDVYTTYTIPNPNPTNPNNHNLLNIARLNSDGSVDPAFSTGSGFPTGSVARGDPQVISALLPASTGKLYVGGSLYFYNGGQVSSLIRLNQDGTLDSTFVTTVGYLTGVSQVQALVPAGDGTQDLYAGLWVGPLIRVHDTGALDTSHNADLNVRTSTIAVTQDGSRDVLLASAGPIGLFRFNRNGAVINAPTFISPTLDDVISVIVPVDDGTGDFYVGGRLTTYNGTAVNHFARVHADGTLASVVTGAP